MEIGIVPSTILSQEEDIADVPLPQNFTDQENELKKELRLGFPWLQLGESSGRVSSGAEKKGDAVGRVSSSEI
uniref:Uncharacterized protein n=1 Tax=Cannabis sativa TaxID=3483 RepID=A0A803QCQ2_CANSA